LKNQLGQISWQQYLKSVNSLAAALLSKSSYQPSERLAVRLGFLRQLARLQLDPARMELVTAFFDSYLELTAEEERLLEEKLPQELAVGEVKEAWKSQRHGIGRAGRKAGRRACRKVGKKVFNRVFGKVGRSYCSSC
jgi:hypothetical protein